ncbi:phenoloxidase-activating factor 2-like [Homarus americanus]|uniref:Phenoloxidase-activating factor 2-like 6 n=1 Tax=Homarus americanus TaxID=6706 RepID=A0A8J5JPZ4_HOMAM|nr:phenoloxidase-activating factor 2-like [Homarus americanus]XP_042237828.1 phenoloxidase-activating factor 2-like [Homarus americanus]KAG7160166.1 Phenoloxidase-activating factor 2-like 6 [Homarus americanus]
MSPASPPRWVQLVMVGVVVSMATAGPAPPSTPLRVKRQLPGIGGLSIEELKCRLENSADISNNRCSELNNENTGPPPPNSECTCTRYWKCRDDQPDPSPNVRPVSITGGLLNKVDLKSGISNVCQVPEDICCKNVDPSENISPVEILPYEPKCGRHNPQGSIGALFQGFTDRQAQFGEYPWMALIRRADRPLERDRSGFVGGGSLISRTVVMTATHTLNDLLASQLMVRLGEWNLEDTTEPVAYQEIPVRLKLNHPNYSAINVEYDVSLLILQFPAMLGPTIDTICLPTPGQNFDGLRCRSSGWGKDSFGAEGKFNQIMKNIDLPVVSHNDCQNALRKTNRLGSDFNLHQSFMCAGGEQDKDACTGDGGSPLVCPSPEDPSRYYQVGIVAWGIGCGVQGLPGVYVNVPEVIPWVSSVLQANLNFDIRSDPTAG